ncbi:MBL fold metallo-hydrolase [Rubritalea tangerina]|uniref:MBL fold metallo-hydrolase n=1 Tax=Rubritalea tangerina TaxID=430798 RepID=A0ABW4ZDT7_9BACT
MHSQPSNLSRRQFGGIAVATAALSSLLPSRASGEESKNAIQAPKGMLQTQWGDYTITSLLDGVIPMKRELFSGRDKEVDSILEQIGQSGGTLPSPISAFLLTSAKHNILIDSGFGALDMFGPGFGNVLNGLYAAGLTPEKIDKVIITHAHPDHIGGMLSKDGNVVFPNAELIIAEKEAQFWNSKAMMEKAPDSAKGVFQLAQKVLGTYKNQMNQVASGKEVAPGIQLDLSPGHTPGHSILTIDGGDKPLKMIADTLHNCELHTALPDIAFAFDLDPKQAVAARIKLFDQLSADKALVLGSHVHFPGYGRILKVNNAYRFITATI